MLEQTSKAQTRKIQKAKLALRNLLALFIKIFIVVVVFTAFIVCFADAPNSNSYFTDRVQSEIYRVDF